MFDRFLNTPLHNTLVPRLLYSIFLVLKNLDLLSFRITSQWHKKCHRSNYSQMFFKINILKNFVIFTGKQLWWCLNRLQHRCFPWILRNFSEHLQWRLLMLWCILPSLLTGFHIIFWCITKLKLSKHFPRYYKVPLKKLDRKSNKLSFEDLSLLNRENYSLPNKKNKKWIRSTVDHFCSAVAF